MAHSDPKTRPVPRREEFIAALELLVKRVSIFNDEPSCPLAPCDERERYASVLISVAQFFTTLAGRPVGDRFFELASALADLNTGTVAPLLSPVPPGNRPADPSRLWRARARAAVGLEALIRTGLHHTDAAAEIARTFPDLGKLAGAKARSSKLATTLLGWRKEFTAGRVKNFEANQLFSEGIRRLAGLTTPQSHRDFASCQLTEAVTFSGVLSPSS